MSLTKHRAVENQNRLLLDRSYKINENVVVFSAANTEEHELAKARICFYLKKHKRSFVTEAILKSGGRADVLDLSRGIAYEVMHSEEQKSIELKKEKYKGLTVVEVDALVVNKAPYQNLYAVLD